MTRTILILALAASLAGCVAAARPLVPPRAVEPVADPLAGAIRPLTTDQRDMLDS